MKVIKLKKEPSIEAIKKSRAFGAFSILSGSRKVLEVLSSNGVKEIY